jgi:tryptophan-rich sensory protein
MTGHAAIGLAGFIGVCLLAASSGAVFRAGAWSHSLAKPRWRPPGWLFGPAWAVLYLTIAVSGWHLWRSAGFAAAAMPFLVYFVSLLLNAAWSALFFGLRRLDLACLDILLLWLSIIVTVAVFAPLDRVAALLLVPYLCWVTFAAALNVAVWRLNRPPAARQDLAWTRLRNRLRWMGGI